jgi:hypothetical protein
MIEHFSHLPPVSKKFETAQMVYLGAWGKLIHEKEQKSKISWHCPFKNEQMLVLPGTGVNKLLNTLLGWGGGGFFLKY